MWQSPQYNAGCEIVFIKVSALGWRPEQINAFRRKLAFIKVLVGNQAKPIPEIWAFREICGQRI